MGQSFPGRTQKEELIELPRLVQDKDIDLKHLIT